MTSICAGGTSGAKPAFAAVVDYSSGLIASILASRGLGWLIPVVPLAGLPPLILATFCASDPPAVPTFTAAEANALIELTFGADFTSGVSKLSDLLLHTLWYDACQCTSGSLTVYPTITPPTGTAITQPPLPTADVPCRTFQSATHNFTTGTSFGVSGNNYGHRNVTSVVVTCDTFNHTGTGNTFDFKFEWDDLVTPSFNIVRTDHLTLGNAQHVVFTYVPPAGAYEVLCTISTLTGTGASDAKVAIDVYCDGDVPGGTALPCCPPDVATQAALDQILAMVTLIQRQAVPFGYVPGAVHSALSGAGVIDISGLIGAKVSVTTLPAPIGREGTAPTIYFDMGFLTFGTADGYPTSYRLERSEQVMLPARCGAYTELAYDLHPSVVVTITELLREP